MAVVELERAGYVFISSKFKVNKTNKFGDFELTYGSDAFSSIAEAVQEYQDFSDTMILLNSSTTFTADDAALLSSPSTIAGNITVDSYGMWAEDAEVPAKNTITTSGETISMMKMTDSLLKRFLDLVTFHTLLNTLSTFIIIHITIHAKRRALTSPIPPP